MNCKQTRSQLMEYQIGSLEPEAILQVEKHLSDCIACQGFAAELEQFQHLLQAKTKPALDNSLTKHILEKVANESVTENEIHLPKTYSFASVAAIAVLVLIGVFGGLKLGNRITSGLLVGEAEYSENISLFNEMELEPLEQMLLNINSTGK